MTTKDLRLALIKSLMRHGKTRREAEREVDALLSLQVPRKR